MNNTNTDFGVWVNIYLADFFWNFQIFDQKKNRFSTTVKLENEDLLHQKADRILWTLKFCYSILCH